MPTDYADQLRFLRRQPALNARGVGANDRRGGSPTNAITVSCQFKGAPAALADHGRCCGDSPTSTRANGAILGQAKDEQTDLRSTKPMIAALVPMSCIDIASIS